jgi:hypothetical protein
LEKSQNPSEYFSNRSVQSADGVLPHPSWSPNALDRNWFVPRHAEKNRLAERKFLTLEVSSVTINREPK